MPTARQDPPSDADVTAAPESLRAAWLVSVQSILWTVIASTAAIVIGVTSGSGALVTFDARLALLTRSAPLHSSTTSAHDPTRANLCPP